MKHAGASALIVLQAHTGLAGILDITDICRALIDPGLPTAHHGNDRPR